jgi:hypothetical protein
VLSIVNKGRQLDGSLIFMGSRQLRPNRKR